MKDYRVDKFTCYLMIFVSLLLASCDISGSNDLPMPYHEEKEVVIDNVKLEKEQLLSVLLLHKVEGRDDPVHISLDKKQARAFDAFLPISSGQQFLIRESIITERDGSTYATYHVISRL